MPHLHAIVLWRVKIYLNCQEVATRESRHFFLIGSADFKKERETFATVGISLYLCRQILEKEHCADSCYAKPDKFETYKKAWWFFTLMAWVLSLYL